MPTVHEEGGFTFFIYPNDHTPWHVHVFKGDGEAKISLGEDGEMPWIVASWNMRPKDAYRAEQIAIKFQSKLRRAWDKYHGTG